jgi:hypothetical protein
MDTRFERDLALPVNEFPAMSEGEEWCAMQGSNPQSAVGYQALADAAPQLAPQCCKWPEEVEEIALAWARLPDALKAAVLGIVRSVGADGGVLAKRGLRIVGEEGK